VAAPNTNRPGHVDDDVARQAAASPSAAVRVIITRAHSRDSDNDVRARGGRVIGKLGLGNATVAEVPAGQIAELARQTGVVRIAYDAPVFIQSYDPLSDCCDQLQMVYPRVVGAADQWGHQLRGTGVGVAVIDSGVQSAHPDFQGSLLPSPTRVLQVLNGIAGSALSGTDDNGHGTFVAGIIAGRGWGVPGTVPAGSYIGIAPDSNVVSIKVSDSTGMAHISDVISAIEWVAKNRQVNGMNIRVINLSLVSNYATSYQIDMLDAAVELAWLQGLVVVVAAGNAGPNAPITSPANDPFVMTVGATDDRGTTDTSDDVLAAFSSYGRTVDGFAKPDLVAPGRHIVSTLASPTSPLAIQFPTHVVGGGSYIRMSGTSAATPVVSGVVAQLLQARPSLTPGQVKWLLTHTGRPVAGSGTGSGYPRVDGALNFSGTIGNSNTALPNLYLLAAYLSSSGLSWNSVSGLSSNRVAGLSWNSVSWDSVSWDSVSWDSVSWDSVSWDSVSWDSTFSASVAWLPLD
jgi:serine protease AprX